MVIYQELIEILNRHKRRQLEVIGFDKNEDKNQYERLYGFLETNREASFTDGQELLFTASKNKQYTNFLAGFKRRLINALFLIDVKKSQFGNINDAFFNTWKNLAAIKILLRLHAYNAAEDLVKQTLPHSLAIENFSVSAELYRILLKFSSRQGVDDDKNNYFAKYQENHHKSFQLACAEQLYLRIIAQSVKTRNFSLEQRQMNELALSQVEEIHQDTPSDRIHVYYYLLKHHLLASKKDHDGIVLLMREAILNLADSKATTVDMIGVFNNILMVSLAALERYAESEQAAMDAGKYTESGNLNWFIGKEFQVLINLYQGAYQKALGIFIQATTHRKFKLLGAAKRDNWIIIEAFLQLLYRSNELELSPEHKLNRFSLAKFQNEVDFFTKDKQGYNITIQILQVLFLLQSKKWDLAEDRIASTYKYAQRHLKENLKTRRAFFFISAISQIPRGHFSIQEVDNRALPWLEKMRATDLNADTDPFEVEVIPYEQLWRLIRSFLLAY